jgi:hypothetical protein
MNIQSSTGIADPIDGETHLADTNVVGRHAHVLRSDFWHHCANVFIDVSLDQDVPH